MLLRLRRGLSRADLDSVSLLARELGYRSRFLGGRDDLLELERIDGSGSPESPQSHGSPDHRSRFEDLTAVRQVIDETLPSELFHKRPGVSDTVVAAGDARFGGGSLSLIAGPCAVENHQRLVEIGLGVRAAGATLMRGGAYKPRTSPYSFQGLGRDGLKILGEVRAETGLGVVTEVLDPRDLEAVVEVADMLQIGARSMTNFALLNEVGRVRTPVLLKRGFAASVREWFLAAEYILAGGNTQVLLCERGIRSFDNVTRNILDVGAVAHAKRTTHLPVIVDPSHAAGRADLVRSLARAGIAAGADGLMIEVHPAPGEVHSDGAQAVSLDLFASITRDVRALCALDDRRLVTSELQGSPHPS
jgi:3-deoxy-7-phosphoheptulonate synthase